MIKKPHLNKNTYSELVCAYWRPLYPIIGVLHVKGDMNQRDQMKAYANLAIKQPTPPMYRDM